MTVPKKRFSPPPVPRGLATPEGWDPSMFTPLPFPFDPPPGFPQVPRLSFGPRPGWTTVHSTFPEPWPENPQPKSVKTERLLLRPFRPSDLPAVHALHSQPEVMRWTQRGVPHETLDETQAWLQRFLYPPGACSLNWAICLRRPTGPPAPADGEDPEEARRAYEEWLAREDAGEEQDDDDDRVGYEGELIGVGGVHEFHATEGGDGSFGWPEVGYLLRSEYWGRGLATEFLGAYVAAYRGLLRDGLVQRNVKDGSFVRAADAAGGGDDRGDGGPPLVREQLVAVIDATNGASRRVLEKCGFESFAAFEERGGRDPDKVTELVAYRCFIDAAA